MLSFYSELLSSSRLIDAGLFLFGSFAAARTLRWVDKRRTSTVFAAAGSKIDAFVAQIAVDGPENLYLIMDFDRTISRYWDPMRTNRAPTSHGILELGRSSTFRDAAAKVNDHFFPIEVNPSLSINDKIPYMVDWYHQIHNLFVKEPNMTRVDVARAVTASGIELRPGVIETIAWCDRHSVPLIIMSAGIGDVIYEVLLQRYPAPLPTIVYIVSNSMQFDDHGRLVSFSEPVFHMFNKTGASIPEPLASTLRSRRNTILVGDSLGDATMADGLGHTGLLKIGLVNDNVSVLLPKYTERFDIILLDDARLDLLVDLLSRVAE